MEKDAAVQTLIVISIGPVQDFIAQARKTRDLWFGSHLLSELSRAAAEQFQKEGELIMPVLPAKELSDERTEKLPIANKIIGVVRREKPEDFVNEVHDAVQEKWKTYTQQAQKHLEAEGAINPEMWKRQVRDFVEFHAAWSGLSDGRSYRETLERTNQLLAARKTLRDFRQNEPARMYGDKKSSLNPGRESVLLESRYSNYARFGIRKGETLDAVSLVKRLSTWITADKQSSENKASFASVCDLAFSSFRQRLKDEPTLEAKAAELYKGLITECEPHLTMRSRVVHASKADEFDSRLFYPHQIKDFVDEHAYREVSGKKAATLNEVEKKELTSRLRRRIRSGLRHPLSAPSPYYAFLLCDGDRIGDRLKKVLSPELHRQWTERLSRFAVESRIIVQQNDGEFIYGGGDDCMALLPLHTCLQAVDELRLRFAELMRGEQNVAEEEPVTLSAGLVIAHMMEPLGQVRHMAQEAERQAKLCRNRLFVHVQKRGGGEQLKVGMSWKENPVQILNQWRQLYRDNAIPAQLAYDLRQLHRTYLKMAGFPSLASADGDRDRPKAELQNKELLVLEVARLLRKKQLDNCYMQNGSLETISQRMASFIRAGEESALARLEMLAEQLTLAMTLNKMEAGQDVDAN
ncbi:type III-B CRISPR-associated protein Cas10/Cmr2 [Cohnella faecalis]|uniref:type III-B CRISPR-associated protein Cas10/Cmr2 n=1 Tax=Cohnella faecalis TaxID=2315694 RepID=UPI0013148C50|nr:type III-B CRISPR-associated protein Cas10/Cmr2 [Cohnella faecalis]